MLTTQQLENLRRFDTPTICNAVESFRVRGRVDGFTGVDIRCILPSLGVMVGYAVTLTVDSTTPDAAQSEEGYAAWLNAMQASPKPGVLVFQDVGPQPRKSAHFGDVMGTIAQRLGMAGLVTDGGVRDVLELERMGFHLFASGIVPAHGSPRLLAAGQPVFIDGVCVQPGDLIHADAHGVTVIPAEVAEQVAAAAEQVLQVEADLKAFVNGPEFTVERLLRRRFSH
jgi:4-hydroxy-4-methyl-2-oxoglutarate aldolase